MSVELELPIYQKIIEWAGHQSGSTLLKLVDIGYFVIIAHIGAYEEALYQCKEDIMYALNSISIIEGKIVGAIETEHDTISKEQRIQNAIHGIKLHMEHNCIERYHISPCHKSIFAHNRFSNVIYTENIKHIIKEKERLFSLMLANIQLLKMNSEYISNMKCAIWRTIIEGWKQIKEALILLNRIIYEQLIKEFNKINRIFKITNTDGEEWERIFSLSKTV